MRYARTACVVLAIAAITSAQSQSIRNSTPPNPLNPVAYLLDPAGGPQVAKTWSPIVDDSLFSPPPAAGATWFVGVSTGPAVPELVIPGGTILISLAGPNPLAQLGPLAASGGPVSFDIAIPPLCGIVGNPYSTQAFLNDPGMGFRVTNAIDVIIGAGPSGLYSVSSFNNILHRVDTTTGGDIATVPMTIPGWSVNFANGLAKHPFTGELFVILDADPSPAPPGGATKGGKQSGNKRKGNKVPGSGRGSSPGPATGRVLATVCPISGVGKVRGYTGDFFAGIAFDGNGNLWGVTGDGGIASESLFVINQLDGSSVLVTALGAGLDGEMLGYNSADGLLYHGSGNFNFTGQSNFFETVDPASPLTPPVNIPVGTAFAQNDETNAMSAYDPSVGAFWWGTGCCTFGGRLYKLDTSGIATLVGSMTHESKGLALLD